MPTALVTGGAITSTTYTRPNQYTFNDTLVKHGVPGNSYCPYTKFTVPTFDNIKPNYLTLKYNPDAVPEGKYELYGVLNSILIFSASDQTPLSSCVLKVMV